MPRVSLKTKQQLAALRNLAALHSLDVEYSRRGQYATLKCRQKAGKLVWGSAQVSLDSPEMWTLAIQKLIHA